MAEPTIQLGGGNWAGKTDNLLGYYKEGERFYKQDFTFSRSTTGTYTDSDGYIQEMPYNLLQQSNNFDTTWNNYNSTETYDSNLDAWLIEKNGIYGYIRQFITLSGQQTLSVYAKASTLNWLHIKGSNNYAYFDLVNGVLGSYNTTSASIESVDNGFYRCSITYSGAITDVRIYPADGNNDISGTSGSVYIQNAQLVKGTSVKTYFPTTTRLNMPRVDYLNNSNGSLILEPQRSNLVTYSEDFSNAAWLKTSGVTVTSNYGISPDGKQNSTRLQFATNNEQVYDGIVHSGNTETASIYVKGQSGITMQFGVGANISQGSTYTLTGEWQRLEHQSTSGSLFIIGNKDLTATDIEIWGAQLEQGSYPTTLINTSGSSVTRNADACSLTNVADRIGQTEGVLYAEIAKADITASEGGVYLSKDANNEIRLNFATGNRLNVFVNVGGSNQVYMDNTSYNLTDYHKIAIKYKLNDYAVYVDGAEIYTDTSANVPTGLDTINFNSFYGKIRDLKVYNTALSDSELATLTT